MLPRLLGAGTRLPLGERDAPRARTTLRLELAPEMISTENFRVPHILEGSIRCFNQEYLEQAVIEEQYIFYCLEKKRKLWRFFDARTYRSGPFDRDYLVALMEHVV